VIGETLASAQAATLTIVLFPILGLSNICGGLWCPFPYSMTHGMTVTQGGKVSGAGEEGEGGSQ